MREKKPLSMYEKERVSIWGSRGTIPCFSKNKAKYGSNTACISIRLDANTLLIFDAGTGIHNAGLTLPKTITTLYIFLTHFHWDHIQGLPYFYPFMDTTPPRNITILSPLTPPEDAPLTHLWHPSRFPVSFTELPTKPHLVFGDIQPFITTHNLPVSWIPNTHPGNSVAYKIITSTRTIIYATDHELNANLHTTENKARLKFCAHADLLLHDAHFLNSEKKEHEGWGHSFLSDVISFGQKAAVKNLLLFHHHPDRTDAMLDQLSADLTKRLSFPITVAQEQTSY